MKYNNNTKILTIVIIFSLSSAIYAQEYAAQTPYEIMKYEIHVTIPDTYDKFEISTLLDVKNRIPDSSRELRIMLCRNLRGMQPIRVNVIDGEENPLAFTMCNDSLCINVSNLFEHRALEKINIQYDLIPDNEYHDDRSTFACEINEYLCHINAAITRTDNWYPKIEGTMHKRLPEFQLFIDVPAHFEVMASGALVNVVNQGDRKIYEWQNYDEITDRSLYFFAQRLHRIVKKYPNGFNVILYVPNKTLQDNITYIADVIYKSYRFFEDIYGEASGNEYKVMAFPYGYSGLLNAMTIPMYLFTSKIFNDEIYYPIRSVIHEVSHTWWGNLVSADPEEDYWLYEGLAKYSEAIAIKEVVGVDVEKLSFSRLKFASMPYLDKVPAILHAGKLDDWYLQAVTAYYIGATYLKMLEFIIGKKNFFEAMRDYSNAYRGQCVSTADFIAIMQNHSNTDIHNLVSDYLMIPGYARYTLKKVKTTNEGSHYRHTFELENTGDRDIYTEFKVQSDMENYKKRIFMAQNESFTINVKSKQQTSARLVVDPDEIFPVCEDGLKGAGGLVYENEQGDVTFANVVENAPLSDAGIKNNMILLKIDGQDLAGLTLRELNNLLLKHKGTQLKLLVKREEEDPYEVVTSY